MRLAGSLGWTILHRCGYIHLPLRQSRPVAHPPQGSVPDALLGKGLSIHAGYFTGLPEVCCLFPLPAGSVGQERYAQQVSPTASLPACLATVPA